jgi:phosphoribosylglycinamide formyltransferase-1
VRVGVLASGGGSILEAILADGIPVQVVLVDRPCRAIEVAARFGVEAVEVVRDSFGSSFDRVAYTEQVVDALEAHAIDLVVMAGFGTILEKPIHDAFGGRILNSHPALLPAFPGWHAVADALAHGVKVTGTTIHIAGLEVDTGPILAQEAVTVLPDDTVESLHERIKVVERRLYPDTIRQILERGSVLP